MLIDLIERIDGIQNDSVKQKAIGALKKKLDENKVASALVMVVQLDLCDLSPGCQRVLEFLDLEVGPRLSKDKIQELKHRQFTQDLIAQEANLDFDLDPSWVEKSVGKDVPEVKRIRSQFKMDRSLPPQWFIDQVHAEMIESNQNAQTQPTTQHPTTQTQPTTHWLETIPDEAKEQGTWPIAH
ncbi:MAG: hypothetical protein K0U52_07590 [Gammaproteobacteria bacterium]|nr:hypothetical protein [Gammaproteobacteria bacterium]